MKKRANFLFIEKQDDVYTVSMTPELQDDIGTVGFVEFVDEDNVKKDDPILNLEASKTVLEAYSPLTGKIVERNDKAVSEPALLNSAKTEENWLIKLSDVDEAEFNQLEDA
ncbi:glycine cleavage system protein H [Allobacillus sp. GCM10007491]|uniref:Glycine cleavage system protein H n=2 Tax=Allobacillus TaxID=1400133 RepID=A0A941CVV0_9BACI|nr:MULTISPECIES: glycine cleavage system protein H [Allobacillus]MBR7553140.1 glycine cleavage system protein H [Allobacillus saliphilus]TSJ62378.1 glycine cleavage system protein H [Allobacillus salarius]